MGALGSVFGGLWRFLDGWKTFIVAILLSIDKWCVTSSCPSVFGYIGYLIDLMGWRNVAPAVNPADVVAFVMLGVALGHKLVKAYRELRAGTPVSALLSGR